MSKSESRDWQDAETRAVSLLDKGHLLHQLGQNEGSLASYDQAVKICRPFSNECDRLAFVMAEALDSKANALVDLERMAEAVAVFDEAIQVHEGILHGDGTWQDVHGIAISQMNKGRALMLQDRYDDARSCFECALDGFERCDSSLDLARTWLNVGSCYVRQARFNEALAAFDESLTHREAVIEESDVSKGDYAYALYGKADVLLKLGCPDEALEVCDRAIALQRVIAGQTHDPSDREHLADSLETRGRILTKLGRTKEAD